MRWYSDIQSEGMQTHRAFGEVYALWMERRQQAGHRLLLEHILLQDVGLGFSYNWQTHATRRITREKYMGVLPGKFPYLLPFWMSKRYRRSYRDKTIAATLLFFPQSQKRLWCFFDKSQIRRQLLFTLDSFRFLCPKKVFDKLTNFTQQNIKISCPHLVHAVSPDTAQPLGRHPSSGLGGLLFTVQAELYRRSSSSMWTSLSWRQKKLPLSVRDAQKGKNTASCLRSALVKAYENCYLFLIQSLHLHFTSSLHVDFNKRLYLPSVFTEMTEIISSLCHYIATNKIRM